MTTNRAGQLLNVVGQSLKQNSPTILIGVGIAGFVSSIVLAVKATPTAMEVTDELYRKSVNEHKGPPETIDIIEATWKLYIPTASIATLSALSIILANRISLRRQATLMSLYAIADTTLKDYQQAVIDKIGSKKAGDIQDTLSKNRVEKNPISNKNLVGSREEGDHLCYDALSGRYFYSTKHKILTAQAVFNNQLLSNMIMTLNELYFEMGLPNIDIGDSVGWNVEGGIIDIDVTTMVSANDAPCLVVNHRKAPEWLYFK